MKSPNTVFLRLTPEQIQNILACINRAQITGAEAMPIAILKQQIEIQLQEHINGSQTVEETPVKLKKKKREG